MKLPRSSFEHMATKFVNSSANFYVKDDIKYNPGLDLNMEKEKKIRK